MDSKLGLMWSSMSWFVLVLSYLISFYNFSNFYFMCTDVLSACMSVSDDPGITDSCELPCGCWESNLGPLEEQSMLLTTEPSFQLQGPNFKATFSLSHIVHQIHPSEEVNQVGEPAVGILQYRVVR